MSFPYLKDQQPPLSETEASKHTLQFPQEIVPSVQLCIVCIYFSAQKYLVNSECMSTACNTSEEGPQATADHFTQLAC